MSVSPYLYLFCGFKALCTAADEAF